MSHFQYLENKKETMKISAMSMVAFTTLLLVTVTIMVTMNFPFNWVFYLTVFGQAMIVVMVYKVLTDNYTTDKVFEDFYEDNPIGREGS
ncbi:hypothetical protein GCM10011414_01110 [Croceivirga lutea]|nr:hypothetical protein GCM10011414_01110 [Croceivirga lutea]